MKQKLETKEKTLSDLPGAGAATVEKLETAGFSDLMSIAVATPGELIEAAGIGEGVSKRMIAAARAMLDMGFSSGLELLEKRKSVVKIQTGSEQRVVDPPVGTRMMRVSGKGHSLRRGNIDDGCSRL